MFELVIYIFFALAGIVFFALLLPVKIFLHTTGGTEERLEISGRIMIFFGIVGGGLLYRKNNYILNIFLYSWRVLSINIKPIVDYFSRKEKKRREKKVKPLKAKKPVAARVKGYYSKGVKYWEYFKTGFRDLREIIRIDLFSTHIKFGLGNPALTGKLIGLIYSINSILPHPYVITPTWDFTRSVIQGELTIKITFRSHIFWKRFICRLPLIISIIREHKGQKHYSDNTLIVQEV